MQSYGITGSRGVKSDFDKFYTKPAVAQHYLQKLDLSTYDTIIEPSAGSGAFSQFIDACLAFDLVPEADHIMQADWLTLDKSQFDGKTLIVGNPPFGKGGQLALQFIKASSFADTIAFILPRGFKKYSIKNRVPRNLHLTLEEDVPKNAFTLDGTEYDVPCVFQVWKQSTEPRALYRLPKTSSLMKFIPAAEKHHADFRVQRIGGNAGKAFHTVHGAATSNYFVKNTSKLSTAALIDVINTLEYPSIDHTTGPKSLPKGEIIQCLEAAVFTEGCQLSQ